jgi:hypothetical protein
MTIDLLIPAQVTIPDDELLELARHIRERWSNPPDAPVHAQDLVMEAFIRGVLSDEHENGLVGWTLARHEDNEYTDDDLRGFIEEEQAVKPKKKTKRKKA